MSKSIIKEHDHYKSYIPNFNEFQSVYDKYQNLKSLFFMNVDNKIEHKIDSKVKVMGEMDHTNYLLSLNLTPL